MFFNHRYHEDEAPIGDFEEAKETSMARPENPNILKWYGEKLDLSEVKPGQKVTYRGTQYYVQKNEHGVLLLHQLRRADVTPADKHYARVNQKMFNDYCVLWNIFDTSEKPR